MTALADYYDHLLPELPGCLPAMVDLHLRETAREFCSKTSVWRATLAGINLVGGQGAYTLTGLPSDSVVVRVTSLTVAGVLLWADTLIPQDQVQPKYRRDDPPFTMSADCTQIILNADEVPTAAIASGLVVTVALQPTVGATVLPDFLKASYLPALRYGTLSRLMRMGSKKPWSDRELSVDYESRWHQELNFAAFQGDVGNNRKPLRVTKWG